MSLVYYTEIDQLPGFEVIEREINKLPKSLQDKISSYKSLKDKTARICGKLLLKKISDGYLSSVFDLADIKYSPLNKPYFDGGLDFNIAHSGNMVVCAGIADAKIGIDIEQIRPVDADLLKDFFTENEWQEIQNAEKPNLMVFKFWVRKEAFIKATGKGILQQFNEIDTTVSHLYYNNEVFFIRDIFIKEGYAACIATNNFPVEYELVFVDMNGLINY